MSLSHWDKQTIQSLSLEPLRLQKLVEMSLMSTESSTSPPTTPVSNSLSKVPKSLKRKRPSFSGPASSAPVPATDAPKKKKATRACLNCQRAHLTCNDARPCQRCVKKGIADSCTEGHRKKAKYLLDDEELENMKRNKPENGKESVGDSVAVLNTTAESVLPINFGSSFSFGSEATNLEYSMLSAILGNTVDEAVVSLPPPSYPTLSHPQVSQPQVSSGFSATGQESWSTVATGQQPGPTIPRPTSSIYHNHSETPIDLTILPPEVSAPASAGGLGSSYPPQQQQFSAPSTSFLRTNHEQQATAPPSNLSQQHQQQQQQHQQQQQQYSSILLDPPPPPEHVEPSQPQSHGILHADAHTKARISDVYRSVTKPYDYTQGYHFLMQYVQQNFDRNDILRVVRALAVFRPSLIALQMPLTDEDETFVEKCFQRSLIELEKLISFSGTPTVVWRRTGEICLVGMEFGVLTGWTHHELVGQRKYIYELFERQSLVEYWEKFAAHAFENATQSVYSHCILLKPSGEPIPCAFCFSIRRDLFDLPNLVIGQWLPLLG
ncbi:Transcriptional regulator of nonfermentable carbon utilization [Serendipita sp. 405]|nr:Transcriptional regulator of nonfermentable carbon utilization [Serendipita sp. 405]